jgi:hypothetical protein
MCSATRDVRFGPKADIVRYLFFLAFAPLSLDQFCNVLVVVGNPPHDYFAFFMLKALCHSSVGAEEHVALGERHIERQRQIIRELEGDGHDVTNAMALLAQFEELQRVHVANRDRLKKNLKDRHKFVRGRDKVADVGFGPEAYIR